MQNQFEEHKTTINVLEAHLGFGMFFLLPPLGVTERLLVDVGKILLVVLLLSG
jgi:hypothetical protein